MDNSYALLFDLDGTLVSTDSIYVEVWDQILQEKGLSVDADFFEFFIRGKSDVFPMERSRWCEFIDGIT